MNLLSKIVDKFFLKQWSVGVVNESIAEVILNKKISGRISWLPINNKRHFFADPFIFKTLPNEYCILCERMDYKKKYGNICSFTVNESNQVSDKQVLLDTGYHLSYPFTFIVNGTTYVFPESSANGKLSCYKYDKKKNSLSFEKDILDLPLLDSTILNHNNKYWLFGTMRGEDSNKKLYIFFADSLLGPYTPHSKNPVKDNIDGSRPAGNFIEVKGNLYRPTQGSGKYYGSSIIINKILELSEKKFEEKKYFSITPSKKERYNFGIHTINYTEDKIVIDGLKRRFLPFTQLRNYLSKVNAYKSPNYILRNTEHKNH